MDNYRLEVYPFGMTGDYYAYRLVTRNGKIMLYSGTQRFDKSRALRAARNFNPLMAMAADYVVAEVDQIVEPGAIDPDLVMTPGVLINALILAGEQ